MDASTIREDFPEFADTSMFPDGQVNFWLGVGRTFLNAERWGDSLDFGLELFAAHHLSVAAKDQATASSGGVPGQVSGPLASKSVNKVSASYDTGAATMENASFWNMSRYGIQFYRLAMMIGAGGIQL